MSDNPERCFIDTNIWLYAFIEGEEPEKTRKAKQIIDTQHDIVLSTQVVNEMAVTSEIEIAISPAGGVKSGDIDDVRWWRPRPYPSVRRTDAAHLVS